MEIGELFEFKKTGRIEPESKIKQSECKGLIYRANRSQYIQNNIIGERTYLKLLKRKSCPGCEKCGWMIEYLDETISEFLIDLSRVEDKKMYQLMVSVSGGTYEYPYDVDVEIYIKEYKGK